MKILLSLFLLLAVSAFGASPAYTSFRGSGGILIVSNPPNGTIVIDGSAISGSIVAPGDTFNVPLNSNDVFVASSQFNYHQYFFFQEFLGPTLSVNNSAGNTNYMDPFGFGALGPSAFVIATSNATTRWSFTIDGNLVPFVTNRYDVGSQFLPVRSNFVNRVVVKDHITSGTTDPVTTVGSQGLPGSSGTGTTNFARFRNTGDSTALDIGGSSGAGTPLWLQAHDSSDLSVNYALVLQPNGGSVGIRTLAPVSGSSLTLEGGPLVFKTDNTHDIGAVGASRPRTIYGGSDIFAGGDVRAGGSVNAGIGSTIGLLARAKFSSPADGVLQMNDNLLGSFVRLLFGGATAAFPAIGRTNGNLVVFGADGLFGGGGTNSLWLMGGGLIQDFTFTAPRAPERQGAVYWNDGTNVCVVLRNSAGTLTTNKLSMTAWP